MVRQRRRRRDWIWTSVWILCWLVYLGLIVLVHYSGSLAWLILLVALFVVAQGAALKVRQRSRLKEAESDARELEELRARLRRLTG
jgi:hypothetical protein